MDKFHHKLPKDELKKFAREVNKKLVASDYKNNRVDDPTSISPKQEKKVKKFVKEFFDRAVVKYKELEKMKAQRPGSDKTSAKSPAGEASQLLPVEASPAKEDIELSDIEAEDGASTTSSDRKRKRDDELESPGETLSETPSLKRVKEDDVAEIPSPPPPPPPPNDVATPPLSEEERSMREQEEALMRENEEAQRLEDEAERSKRGVETNGDGSVDLHQERHTNGNWDYDRDGHQESASKHNGMTAGPTNGEVASGDGMDVDMHQTEQTQAHSRKHEVLSH